MKFSHQLFTMLALPVLCSTAMAEGSLGALEGMIPSDKLMQGRVIKPVLNPELKGPVAKVQTKFNTLSDERKKELATEINSDNAIPYISELWDSKAEYDAYLKLWEQNGVQEREYVALGMKADETPGVWNVVSATIDGKGKAAAPLTLSALSYNANDNTWTSNNGVLTATPLEHTDKFIFGAQSGTAWEYKNEDALSVMIERVQVTKSADGKFVYVYYNFLEVSKATGKGIAQGGYVLRFAPQAASAANIAKPGQR